jgi:hypothetical protein
MAESTPHLAPIVVLLFLGAIFVTVVSLLILLYGVARRSKRYANIGSCAALGVISSYLLVLCGVSLVSSKKVLPPGGWKYFCELDCHIGYSVSGVAATAAIGPDLQPTPAQGQFIIVRLKIWFDPRTISPHRGDGPLTPNARRVVLLDTNEHAYAEFPAGEAAIARTQNEAGSLRQPLRPGQSLVRDIVFDVPKGVSGLRLLITEDDPETVLIIGHENSLFHRKVYLGLNSAPNITSKISPLAPAN